MKAGGRRIAQRHVSGEKPAEKTEFDENGQEVLARFVRIH